MTAEPSQPVYRGYSQAELDAQYDQATLVPDLTPYLEAWRAESERARATLECRLDVAYGPGEKERLDIFPACAAGAAAARRRPAGEATPVAVLIHGGAWRRELRDRTSFPAPAFVEAGVALIVPGFAAIPDSDLAGMVHQVRAAVAWVYRNASQFGGDAARLHLLGHSSGAHLAGMVLAEGWRAAAGLPEDLIKSAVLASGAYDLEPCRLSARNSFLKLDPETAARLGPPRHIPETAPPVLIAWGENELAEYKRQARAFAQAWRLAGHAARELELAGANHFDVFTAFGDPEGPLVGEALRLITCT